jgi:hypothetical protein
MARALGSTAVVARRVVIVVIVATALVSMSTITAAHFVGNSKVDGASSEFGVVDCNSVGVHEVVDDLEKMRVRARLGHHDDRALVRDSLACNLRKSAQCLKR